jgi:anti-sigma factor RsiW
MSDIHALSGAYALDALNDLERAEFDRHLATCESCRAEVASLRDAAGHLADASAAPPPAHLRAQVLAGAQLVRPLPPQTTEPSRRRWRIPALVAAAAALFAGVGVGVTAEWRPWEQPEKIQLTLADRVRQAPDAQSWTQSLPTGGSVTVTRSRSVGAAVWQSTGLKALPSGRVYELWLQAPDESLKPAGLFSAADGEVVMRGDATEAIGAGVTEEPSGGSPAPTTKPIAFIDFRAKS